MTATLKLGYGMTFAELYSHAGLRKLDQAFLECLRSEHAALEAQIDGARAAPDALSETDEAELLIELGRHLDDFVASLFDIVSDVASLKARHLHLAPLFACKRQFVQRYALRKLSLEDIADFDYAEAEAALANHMGGALDELSFARHALDWLDDDASHQVQLADAARYAAWAVSTDEGRRLRGDWLIFDTPHSTNEAGKLRFLRSDAGTFTVFKQSPEKLRRRDGFGLTDCGADLRGALAEANYCIGCHKHRKDSCRQGFVEPRDADRNFRFRRNSAGVTLSGCPLDERISEMHALKTAGSAIGALAMAVVDNPMIAGTGHRICNDCMKACIFQKQQPVDIPQAETRVLKDVLELPYGFEIYSLLTRWNPLNLRRPYPREPSGRRVLVVGLGPAGYTLAHHLMNDGHTVVGVDGLKIEPLPSDVSGVRTDGSRTRFRPIRDVRELWEPLDQRTMAGFGGVAEYGITVRWDKNFLKLIRLLLERRSQFQMFGGIRFGGTIEPEQAFSLGFDHVALAMGAGRPTVLNLPNGLARGVRAASDFLMALQLTGAAKATSIANMQIRLPVIVIGGGLTAIDTATEALAYYPVQVEKFLRTYELLAAERGEAAVWSIWNEEERQIASEFLTHAAALRDERVKAREEDRPPHIASLIDSWGGVTIAYRKAFFESPSFRLNHEEVEKALEEGIKIAEFLAPTEIEVDRFGHARTVRFERTGDDADIDRHVVLSARTVLVAAGTQPNTMLAREHDQSIALNGHFFQAVDEQGNAVEPAAVSKPEAPHPLLDIRDDGRAMSFFGDLHPSFAGNVVKAMASAKRGYPVVSRMLARIEPASDAGDAEFFARLNSELRTTVSEVRRLTPTIIEVVVHAPMAARNFRPGQFFRLQNFESLAPRTEDTVLAMEGLALTGAWVDRMRGLVGLIVLEMGGSSKICSLLKPGEPVVLMGPTGAPTDILEGETVLLAGGGLGNAVLFSIGQALRAAGSRVLYFAAYKKADDRYKVEEIEAAADVVVWCCDEAPGFVPTRPDDKALVGNVVLAMQAYASGGLGIQRIDMNDVDRLIAIGSDRMMAAVAQARNTSLRDYLSQCRTAVGSINSPMQCMMKEICAQCLQEHRDPSTGATSYVFSCSNQDQCLDKVDFASLSQRLRQNSTQEKLTSLWIERCLNGNGLRWNP